MNFVFVYECACLFHFYSIANIILGLSIVDENNLWRHHVLDHLPSFSIALLLLLLLFSFFFFPVPLLPGFLSPSALVRLRRRPTDMRVDATRWRSARPAAVYTRARLVSGLFFLFFFWFGQQKAWSSSFGLRHLRYRCIKRVRCFNYYLVPWHRFVHSSHLALVLALTPSPRQWFFSFLFSPLAFLALSSSSVVIRRVDRSAVYDKV